MQDLKAYGVNTLVRVCAATYDKTPVEQEGIHVLVSDIDTVLHSISRLNYRM